MLKKLKYSTLYQYIKQLIFRYKDDDITGMSAQITYYLIFAFFPFLIFLINLLSFTNLSSDLLITSFNKFIPDKIGDLVENIIVQTLNNKSNTLLSLGMAGSLWATSKAIFAIMKGLNRAYDIEENRKFMKLGFVCFISTLGVIIMIMSTLVMMVFGKIIGIYVFDLVGAMKLFDIVWSILRYCIPSILMFITFSLIYKYVPNKELKFRNIRVGAIFATIGCITTSLLFSLYVNNFGSYEKVYGSLGGMIVLISWLYISTLVILIGGELNAISNYFQIKREIMNQT
nr:YihY/virulence factor BrkB family protein [uncultured Caproiciproducens sp.]